MELGIAGKTADFKSSVSSQMPRKLDAAQFLQKHQIVNSYFLGNLMLNGVEIPMDSQMRRARCRVFHEENERNRMNWLRSFFAALQGVFPY